MWARATAPHSDRARARNSPPKPALFFCSTPLGPQACPDEPAAPCDAPVSPCNSAELQGALAILAPLLQFTGRFLHNRTVSVSWGTPRESDAARAAGCPPWCWRDGGPGGRGRRRLLAGALGRAAGRAARLRRRRLGRRQGRARHVAQEGRRGAAGCVRAPHAPRAARGGERGGRKRGAWGHTLGESSEPKGGGLQALGTFAGAWRAAQGEARRPPRLRAAPCSPPTPCESDARACTAVCGRGLERPSRQTRFWRVRAPLPGAGLARLAHGA